MSLQTQTSRSLFSLCYSCTGQGLLCKGRLLGLQTLCIKLCFLSISMLTVQYYYSALKLLCKFPFNKALSCTAACQAVYLQPRLQCNDLQILLDLYLTEYSTGTTYLMFRLFGNINPFLLYVTIKWMQKLFINRYYTGGCALPSLLARLLQNFLRVIYFLNCGNVIMHNICR